MGVSSIISTTGGNLYMIALDSLERIEIQYVPKELALTRNAKLGELAIVGRNIPKNHQTGGSKFLKFTLDFYSVKESAEGRDDVIKKLRLLESWTYNEGIDRNAEKIKLVYGSMFRDEIWTVQTVDIKMVEFEKQTFLPLQAYVNVTLKLDTNKNPKRSDVI